MDAARAIENLIHRYAELVDAGDFAGVGALFAEAEYGAEGARGVRGARAVEALLREFVILHEDGTPRTRHVTTNVHVEVDDAGRTATARSTFTVFQAAPGAGPAPVVLGRYHDAFARAGEGWRFAARRIRMEQVGDLSRHLRRPEVAR